jgi:hypothetical protein
MILTSRKLSRLYAQSLVSYAKVVPNVEALSGINTSTGINRQSSLPSHSTCIQALT